MYCKHWMSYLYHPYLATEAEVKHAGFGSVFDDEMEDVAVVFVSNGFARFPFDEGVHAVP